MAVQVGHDLYSNAIRPALYLVPYDLVNAIDVEVVPESTALNPYDNWAQDTLTVELGYQQHLAEQTNDKTLVHAMTDALLAKMVDTSENLEMTYEEETNFLDSILQTVETAKTTSKQLASPESEVLDIPGIDTALSAIDKQLQTELTPYNRYRSFEQHLAQLNQTQLDYSAQVEIALQFGNMSIIAAAEQTIYKQFAETCRANGNLTDGRRLELIGQMQQYLNATRWQTIEQFEEKRRATTALQPVANLPVVESKPATRVSELPLVESVFKPVEVLPPSRKRRLMAKIGGLAVATKQLVSLKTYNDAVMAAESVSRRLAINKDHSRSEQIVHRIVGGALAGFVGAVAVGVPYYLHAVHDGRSAFTLSQSALDHVFHGSPPKPTPAKHSLISGLSKAAAAAKQHHAVAPHNATLPAGSTITEVVSERMSKATTTQVNEAVAQVLKTNKITSAMARHLPVGFKLQIPDTFWSWSSHSKTLQAVSK